jgi:hypothetical protein
MKLNIVKLFSLLEVKKYLVNIKMFFLSITDIIQHKVNAGLPPPYLDTA